MDLLEIRKKAKKRKSDSVVAVEVEPRLDPVSAAPEPAPVVIAAPVPELTIDDNTFGQEFNDFLLRAEEEPRPAPQTAVAPVKGVSKPAAKPEVSPERDLDLETFAKALGHEPARKEPDAVKVDSAFLDLATEELYRHSYLDNESIEQEALCELLSCMIADEQYGVNIHKIKEIIKMREITEVPRAPKFILGIITLRGRVIPIFDLRERLSLETKAFSRHTKIVVVHHKEELYGLIVDAVIDVARFPLGNIESTPQVMVGVEAKYIEGIGRAGDQMIILLNLDEVLSLEAVAA